MSNIKVVNFFKEKIPPIFYILSVFSIAICIGAYINYKDEVSQIVVQKKNELAAITDLKTKQIEAWRKERLNDAEIIKRNPFLFELLCNLQENKNVAKIKSEVRQWLRPMIINNNYKDIVIVSDSENLLMTVSGLPFYMSRIDSENVAIARNKNQIYFTDLYLKKDESINIDIIIPFNKSSISSENEHFAYVIIKIDPTEKLYPLIESWPTPSKTSETLIVERFGNSDSIVYLNELKFIKNTALKLKFSLKDTMIPAVKAVLGIEGIFEGTDYRKEKVLAQSKRIENTHWFMITKIDIDEIYEPLTQKTKWFAFFIILIIILTISSSWQLWVRRKTKDREKLYESQIKTITAEKKFQVFFENSSGGISITEIDGSVNSNSAFVEMLGYTRAELSGIKWQSITHLDDIELTFKMIQELTERKVEKVNFEKRFIHKNGSEIWCLINSTLHCDENDNPLFLLTNITNISENKKAQDALRKSEERYRGLFDNIEAGIVVHAPDTSILMSNQKASELLGLSIEQLQGKLVIDPRWKFLLTNNEPLAIEEYPVNKVASTKKPINNLVLGIFRPETQDIAWLIVNGFPVFDEHGEISEILISFIDVTERQKSSNKVLKLNNELALKNEELEQLIYVASHDLRSPLVNIQGFNSELKQALKTITNIIENVEDQEIAKEKIIQYLNGDFKESVDFIDISAEKISKLISGLLKVSRLSRTLTTINEVNINKLISNIVSTFEFTVKSNNISIEVNDLPNCYGDELMLDQLFSNLIGNAIKFKSSERLPKISISGTNEGDTVIYCVADNGVGFSTEYLDKIFLLFHRLDSKTEGEGLGLAIVKKIIDKHNGLAWAESTPNIGSKFFISIPNKKINL